MEPRKAHHLIRLGAIAKRLGPYNLAWTLLSVLSSPSAKGNSHVFDPFC
jgi:hypothetical protein